MQWKFKKKLFPLALMLLLASASAACTPELFAPLAGTEELGLLAYYEEPLAETAESDTEDGAAKYGAVIKLGDLDALGRPTFAHIRVRDSQEPGTNGETRNERINIDPAGWTNYKQDGAWVNNRCHLVGYQFSGLNDEARNLATGTAYVNKGAAGDGTDEDNPDGMLFYEQRLDGWLYDNQGCGLDLYVAPVYEGISLVPDAFYMQWVGFDADGRQMAIDIGGHSENIRENINGVLLFNVTGREAGLYEE